MPKMNKKSIKKCFFPSHILCHTSPVLHLCSTPELRSDYVTMCLLRGFHDTIKLKFYRGNMETGPLATGLNSGFTVCYTDASSTFTNLTADIRYAECSENQFLCDPIKVFNVNTLQGRTW